MLLPSSLRVRAPNYWINVTLEYDDRCIDCSIFNFGGVLRPYSRHTTVALDGRVSRDNVLRWRRWLFRSLQLTQRATILVQGQPDLTDVSECCLEFLTTLFTATRDPMDLYTYEQVSRPAFGQYSRQRRIITGFNLAPVFYSAPKIEM